MSPESLLDSTLALAQANLQLDHPYGMCYPRPLHSEVLVIPSLPIAFVQKWSVSPADRRAWGPAHAPRTCPDYANHGPCTHSGCRIRLYADGISRGSSFPPIAVIYRPFPLDPLYGPWLVDDGLHRISALVLLGRPSISALVAADTLLALRQASDLALAPALDLSQVL